MNRYLYIKLYIKYYRFKLNVKLYHQSKFLWDPSQNGPLSSLLYLHPHRPLIPSSPSYLNFNGLKPGLST